MQRLCSAVLSRLDPREEGNDGEKLKYKKHTHCGRGRWHSRFPQHLHFHWPVPFGSPAGNQKAAGRTLASAGALLSPGLRGVKRTDLASFSPGQWSSSKPHPRTGIGEEMPMLRACSLPAAYEYHGISRMRGPSRRDAMLSQKKLQCLLRPTRIDTRHIETRWVQRQLLARTHIRWNGWTIHACSVRQRSGVAATRDG
jgi:hypothetical protein